MVSKNMVIPVGGANRLQRSRRSRRKCPQAVALGLLRLAHAHAWTFDAPIPTDHTDKNIFKYRKPRCET